MPCKTILFDLDGTLSDPLEGIGNCILYALENMGQPRATVEELHWCVGPPLRESFGKLLSTNDDSIIEEAVAHYRERFASVGLYENKLYPGIVEALENLKSNNTKIYLATSKPLIYAERIIEHFKLSAYFTGLYGSSLDGKLVCKKELIAHVIKSESLDSSSAIMVGDRATDIHGAQHNSLKAVAVTYGYGSPEELTTANPQWVVDSPEELRMFLCNKPLP